MLLIYLLGKSGGLKKADLRAADLEDAILHCSFFARIVILKDTILKDK
jgi:hypothetical protein